MRRLPSIVVVCCGLAACAPPPKAYDFPAWGFSAAFQAPPQTTNQPGGVKHRAVLIEADSGGRDFAVYAIDAPQPPRTIDQFTDLASPVIAQAAGGVVAARTYVATVQTTNQAMGRELEISKDGRPFMSVRIYQVGGRYYEVGAQSQLGPSDPAAIAFLDSFKILGPAPAAATANAATNAGAGTAASAPPP